MYLTPRKYLIRYISVRRTSSIIPRRNASCNILRICFNGSKITTCLTHDQINDKREMPILSEETFLKSGKLFKKNFQSRSLNTCAASSTQCPNFRGFFTSKVRWHYTWNLKPKRCIETWYLHIECKNYSIVRTSAFMIRLFTLMSSRNAVELQTVW